MKAAAAAHKGMVSSSPGRSADKLPAAPGLVSLLRGKSGSRSRGRAPPWRASPMFVAGRRGAAEPAEPSSPKVTCIGQVRIRTKKRASKPRKGCRCRALTCNPFSWKIKAAALRRMLCGKWWALPLRLRLRSRRERKPRRARERDEGRGVPPLDALPRSGGSDGEEESEEEETETRVFVSSATTTPPKNALLLMRCRSAPHNRASSLATRFWVSPLAPPESPAAEDSGRAGEASAEEEEEEEERGSGNGGASGDGETRPSLVHPLVLMRSKSEPARKGAKLVAPPYWNNATASNRRRLAAPNN